MSQKIVWKKKYLENWKTFLTLLVGAGVGEVGWGVGLGVDCSVGWVVGLGVGCLVGFSEGGGVDTVEGGGVGWPVEAWEGAGVGLLVCITVVVVVALVVVAWSMKNQKQKKFLMRDDYENDLSISIKLSKKKTYLW